MGGGLGWRRFRAVFRHGTRLLKPRLSIVPLRPGLPKRLDDAEVVVKTLDGWLEESRQTGEEMRLAVVVSRGRPGQHEGRRLDVLFAHAHGLEGMLGLLEGGKAFLFMDS